MPKFTPHTDACFYLRFPRVDADALLAVGVEDAFVVEHGQTVDWSALDAWLKSANDWIFGWIGYDARHALHRFNGEKLVSSSMPTVLLIRPLHVAQILNAAPRMVKGEWNSTWNHWLTSDAASSDQSNHHEGLELLPVVSEEEYRIHANDLMHHIQIGNVYEANYCIDFNAHQTLRDCEATWKKLNALTQAPFAGYAQCGPWHLLCASPERYLKREGNRVMSQPIKGTKRRGVSSDEDERLKSELHNSRKERAENVMIVDLVRNDLSRCAKRGSVRVDELFGVHTFPTVHHLMSTISCEVEDSCSFVDLLMATFPMGSMTGAPKISAMEWIGRNEKTSRGLYSGTLGYIEPNGDFDFNVVIRSIQYDAQASSVSCNVGGAITALSDIEAEFEECKLKAAAVLNALR
jgi:para-aminobenzoate synthetase component 1